MSELQVQNFISGNNFDFCSYKKIYTTLSLTSIILPQNQPRKYFDPQKLLELTNSIQQHGILEPLIVRYLSTLNDQYELVAGERRYRAAKEAGLREVPVAICHFSDDEAITISLVDNLQREDLNPVEETEGIITLLSIKLNKSIKEVICLLYQMNNKQKKASNHNVIVSQEEMIIQESFQAFGQMKWDSFVSNRLPILNLPEDVLLILRSGKIAYTKAIAISSIKENKLRQVLMEEAINQNLSLSQIRKKIKEYNSQNLLPTWEQRVQKTMKRLVKSRLWENPTKKEQAELLLIQLEELISK